MTSLSEVYEGGVRTVVGRRRRLLAMVLFAVGVTLGTVAILLTTTGVRSWVGLEVIEARRTGGVLAGLGLPAALLGIFGALPASDETRAAAAIGGSLTVFGVLLFAYAYPDRWLASDPAFALATVAIYALGTLVTFWCLFVAVATFNRRNDPGGTARVEITDEGKLRLVSSPSEDESGFPSGVPAVPGLGGVGMIGRDPRGDVPTQTNVDRPDAESERPATDPSAGSETLADADSDSRQQSAAASETNPEARPQATSDGGHSVADDHSAEFVGDSPERGQPDRYCGNCAHFEYVEVSGDLDPYCGYHQEFMDDLEACDEWTRNTTRE